MDSKVTAELNRQEMTPLHNAILKHVKQCAQMSRDTMGRRYSGWDYSNDVYKGIRRVDSEDRDKLAKGKPIKAIVPLNYAQIHTWVSFLFLLCTQNRNFYELTPTGDEDFKKRPDCELVLEADVQRNMWPYVLFQFLLDVARFGLGVLEVSWTEEYAYFLPSQVPQDNESKEPDMFNQMMVSEGGTPPPSTDDPDDGDPIKILRFEGNAVQNISPYRWFPDPRFPLVQFQKGNFCGHEEDFSRLELECLEEEGEVAGIKYLPEMTQKAFGERGNTRIGFNRYSDVTGEGRRSGGSPQGNAPENDLGVDILTKMQVKIIPSKFKLEDGTFLGKEKWKVLYLAWMANDMRIVRLEPANTLHGMFGYGHAEFTADMHDMVREGSGGGLGDIIDKLQSTVSWFFNSHIKGVDRVNKNQIVYDPEGVDGEAIGEDDSKIKLRKGASKTGVDRWVKQLQVSDATQNHMNDVEILTKLIQLVTGVNDNAMGQYNSGRRSATEARAVTSGAAGRMKTTGSVIWATAFTPVGRQMLTNARAGMSMKMFARIVGEPDEADAVGQAILQERYTAFKGTLEDIVSATDFFVWDATLNSEKGFIAQSMQELLQVMLTNPVVSQMLDIDIKALFDEMMYLRGVPNIDRFSLSKNVAAGTTPAPPALPPDPNAPSGTPPGPGAPATQQQVQYRPFSGVAA